MNQGFYYYFCMMIEGSVSGRPKKMWNRWIRIRNTAYNVSIRTILDECGRATVEQDPESAKYLININSR